MVRQEQFPGETEPRYLEFVKGDLAQRYAEFIGNEIQKAYLESYDDYGQNLFDRYVAYADAWIEDLDFKDPDTGQLLNRDIIDQELSKTEKPAGISNPKDSRNEVVKFALRTRASNDGRNPSWTSYEKIQLCAREISGALPPPICCSIRFDLGVETGHQPGCRNVTCSSGRSAAAKRAGDRGGRQRPTGVMAHDKYR